MFSLRLICADSYQAPAIPEVDPVFSEFKGTEITKVPVIRLFGTTPQGNTGKVLSKIPKFLTLSIF